MNRIKLRIYLETTIFNRYFEDEREYYRETKQLFGKIQEGEIAAYTSVAVLKELMNATEPKRQQMLNLVEMYKLTVLDTEKATFDLADEYVDMGIIPEKYRIDGVHISVASIYNLDCIISLNFRHINKLKTKILIEAKNSTKGYNTPFICTPMEVLDNES